MFIVGLDFHLIISYTKENMVLPQEPIKANGSEAFDTGTA